MVRVLIPEAEPAIAGLCDGSKIEDLLATGESLLTQAYRRGYRDGIASAKARIVSSLADLDDTESDTAQAASVSSSPLNRKQSAHGTVRPLVLRVLTEHPGSAVVEVQKYAAMLNSEVSPLSVGGELRRLKGRFYHQRARRWYLTEDGKREAAGIARQATPAASHSNGNLREGESHETPVAASPSE